MELDELCAASESPVQSRVQRRHQVAAAVAHDGVDEAAVVQEDLAHLHVVDYGGNVERAAAALVPGVRAVRPQPQQPPVNICSL